MVIDLVRSAIAATIAAMSPTKSLPERLLQALAFESLAILVCTPLFAWLFGTGWQAMRVVTIVNCLIALAWNVAFNAAFDRLLARRGRTHGVASRTLHAPLFEGGLVLVCVPFAAWWLGIAWLDALLLDAGLLLFFLPYTWAFHWSWDRLRAGGTASASLTDGKRCAPGPDRAHSSCGL